MAGDPLVRRRVIVAWAAHVAERVLPIFEARYPYDARPRAAIEAVRAWVRGEATREQVRAAADAAYAAAANAARAAAASYAADAERTWQRLRLAAYALGEVV